MLEMWIVGKTINIKVLPSYIYDAEIISLGNEKSSPGNGSMWGWVKHLREKNWWDKENEIQFIELAKKICG